MEAGFAQARFALRLSINTWLQPGLGSAREWRRSPRWQWEKAGEATHPQRILRRLMNWPRAVASSRYAWAVVAMLWPIAATNYGFLLTCEHAASAISSMRVPIHRWCGGIV